MPRSATTIGAHCSAVLRRRSSASAPRSRSGSGCRSWPRGEAIGCFGLTEPIAGSDAAGIRTTAVPDGHGNYIINGAKQWITNGSFADVIVLLASPTRRKASWASPPFLVPMDTPGFERGGVEDTMGIRGSQQAVLNFNDMKVPADWILGGKRGLGRGFMYAMKTLDAGRIGVAAMSCGMAQGAMEKAIEFVKNARAVRQGDQGLPGPAVVPGRDGRPTSSPMRNMVYRVAADKDAGKDVATQAAMIKLFCTETAQRVIDNALQLHGGYGYCKEYDIERYYRDIRITRIYEGTNEIQKNIIARDVLKKDPRTWY